MRFVGVDRSSRALLEPISASDIERVARAALGESAEVVDARLLESGNFNTCYRVDVAGHEPLLLRLAPRAGRRLWRHEQAQLQRQCSVQSHLVALGAVIPALLHTDFSQHLLDRDFAWFRWHDGILWSEVAETLDDAAQRELWAEYGALVRRLHQIPGTDYGWPSPSPSPSAPHASHADWLTAFVDGLTADLADEGIAVDGIDDYRAALRAGRARLDACGPPRLVHGDLWTRNVLVTQCREGWRISALLDAERAFFGEPAAEWIFGWLDLPEAFWQSYGTSLADAALTGDALWRRRAHQALGALRLILDSVRFGFDAAIARENFARALQEGLVRGS